MSSCSCSSSSPCTYQIVDYCGSLGLKHRTQNHQEVLLDFFFLGTCGIDLWEARIHTYKGHDSPCASLLKTHFATSRNIDGTVYQSPANRIHIYTHCLMYSSSLCSAAVVERFWINCIASPGSGATKFLPFCWRSVFCQRLAKDFSQLSQRSTSEHRIQWGF